MVAEIEQGTKNGVSIARGCYYDAYRYPIGLCGNRGSFGFANWRYLDVVSSCAYLHEGAWGLGSMIENPAIGGVGLLFASIGECASRSC